MISQEPETVDQFLTEQEAADLTSFSCRTLQAWRHRNVGPPFIRVRRSIRYSKATLLSWMQAQIQIPTAPTTEPLTGMSHVKPPVDADLPSRTSARPPLRRE
jgi:hypothetical protein